MLRPVPNRLLAFTLLLSLFAAPSAQARSAKVDDLWARARSLIEQGQEERALEPIRQAVAEDPRDMEIQRTYQDLMQARGFASEVLEEARARRDREPTVADWHYLYGRATGQPVPAREAFERALSIDANHTWSLQGLGGVEAVEGKLPAAIERFKQSLALRSDDAETWNKLANVLLAAGRTAEAKEAWRTAMQRVPGDATAALNLGALLSLEGQLDEAITLLDRAVATSPGSPQAHTSLGYVLFKAQRFDEALAHFEAALAISPKDGETRAGRDFIAEVRSGRIPFAAFAPYEAALQAQEQDPALAVQKYKEVLALAPGFAMAQQNLGLALAALGKSDDAVAALRRATELAPKDVGPWLNLGSLHLAMRKIPEARVALSNALALAPKDVDALAALALCDLADGKGEAAAARYKSAIDLAPRDPLLWVQLAGAWGQVPDLPQAEKALRQALSLAPTLLDARVQLVACLRAQGRYDEAIKEITILEKSAPGHADLAAEKAALVAGKSAKAAEALPGKIHLLQIVVRDRAKADELAATLQKGGSFEALAARHSEGPERLRSGDAGWVDPKDLRPEIGGALQALAPGAHSGVIDLGGIYVIVKRGS